MTHIFIGVVAMTKKTVGANGIRPVRQGLTIDRVYPPNHVCYAIDRVRHPIDRVRHPIDRVHPRRIYFQSIAFGKIWGVG